jgi:hypothetical protein
MDRLCRLFNDSFVLVDDPSLRGLLALARPFSLSHPIAGVVRDVDCCRSSHFPLAKGNTSHKSAILDTGRPSIRYGHMAVHQVQQGF